MKINGKCLIVCAPSGAGKTTIVRHLLKTFEHISFSVSAASREPRPGEVDGVHYHFISVDDFKQKISAGEFIEWEEVYSEQYYGTLKSEIRSIWEKGHHVIFDVDVEGGVNLKNEFGDAALAIFIRPPSIEVLEQRLQSRGTETPESLKKRLAKAEKELSYENRFDVTVVNNVLEKACERAEELVREFLKES
jgi:guanylate kinase